MKTTVEIPNDLHQRAKAEAAARGRKLQDLIVEGLRLVLRVRPKESPRATLSELTKHACGIIDSGVSDLGSNPQHLEGFGESRS
jgi:hypothetical protein